MKVSDIARNNQAFDDTCNRYAIVCMQISELEKERNELVKRILGTELPPAPVIENVVSNHNGATVHETSTKLGRTGIATVNYDNGYIMVRRGVTAMLPFYILRACRNPVDVYRQIDELYGFIYDHKQPVKLVAETMWDAFISHKKTIDSAVPTKIDIDAYGEYILRSISSYGEIALISVARRTIGLAVHRVGGGNTQAARVITHQVFNQLLKAENNDAFMEIMNTHFEFRTMYNNVATVIMHYKTGICYFTKDGV